MKPQCLRLLRNPHRHRRAANPSRQPPAPTLEQQLIHDLRRLATTTPISSMLTPLKAITDDAY